MALYKLVGFLRKQPQFWNSLAWTGCSRSFRHFLRRPQASPLRRSRVGTKCSPKVRFSRSRWQLDSRHPGRRHESNAGARVVRSLDCGGKRGHRTVACAAVLPSKPAGAGQSEFDAATRGTSRQSRGCAAPRSHTRYPSGSSSAEQHSAAAQRYGHRSRRAGQRKRGIEAYRRCDRSAKATADSLLADQIWISRGSWRCSRYGCSSQCSEYWTGTEQSRTLNGSLCGRSSSRDDPLKSVLITFSGIDGAGKTTQIEKLRDYLAQVGVPVCQRTLWDDVVLFRNVRSGFSRTVLQSDGAIGTPERPAQRRDKNTQAWPLLLGRCILHLFDVLNLRRIVKKARAEAAGVIIFDRYIYDQFAALPMDRWLPRSYARLLLSIAPKPELSYLLDAVPEVARARKPDYPLEVMHKYRTSSLNLQKIPALHVIPAADPDEMHLAILDPLHNSLFAFSPQT